MTEGNETDSGGNAIDTTSQTTITVPIISGQLFGPFSNPLQWLSLKSCASACDTGANNNTSYGDLFSSINIARDSHQQNMQVVYKNGHFYFEAIKNIDFISSGQNNGDSASLPKTNELPSLYAWFNDAIKANLPTASSSTLNGGTRFYCPLCNEVFLYPNPVVLHMLCTCPKRVHIESIPPPNGQKRRDEPAIVQSTPQQSKSDAKSVSKKRGFDIASLVSNEDGSSDCSYKNRAKNGTVVAEVTGSYNQSEVISSSSAFHSPSSADLASNSSVIPMSSSFSNSFTSSAFTKVDQKRNDLIDNASYDLSAFYQRLSSASSSFPSVINHSSLMPSMSMSSPLSTPLLQSQTRSIVSGALLPYLPPSLAALTYPTTNWCAKCNASFRMTSDLVYHMRLHHKDVTSVAEQTKKKREEKLKCNICHETFRERHHLTRHMASHQ